MCSFPINENANYYMSISNPSVNNSEVEKSGNPKNHTLVHGVHLQEEKRLKEAEVNNIWGYLVFSDINDFDRQRIITLSEKPQLKDRNIICKSDAGDIYQLQVVTKELWNETLAKFYDKGDPG